MREPVVEVRGTVITRLRDNFFRVAVTDNDTVIARVSGRMMFNKIAVAAGDAVVVEMTPYDLTKGRIIWRLS
jgi:translation initiation factor IF-1